MRIPASTPHAIRRRLALATTALGFLSLSGSANAGWLTDLINHWFESPSGAETSDPSSVTAPPISDDEQSADFLEGVISSESPVSFQTGQYKPYSKRLAKVLSQLTTAEQSIVFYGS